MFTNTAEQITNMKDAPKGGNLFVFLWNFILFLTQKKVRFSCNF